MMKNPFSNSLEFANNYDSTDELTMALRCHKLGDYITAEDLYRKHIESNPSNKIIFYLLGLLESQTQRPEMAKCHLEVYLKYHPNDCQAQNVLALAYFDLGNYAAAQILFNKLVKNNHHTASVFYNLAQTYLKLKQFSDAIDAYTNALTLEPHYVNAHIGIGISLREIKQYRRAMQALTNAISIEPFNAEAHFLLGNVMRDLAELHASIYAYRRALEIKSNYIEAAINCGNSYKDLGSDKEAIHYYDIALQIDKNHPEANYNKSLVLLNTAQFEAGWSLYEWRFKSSEAQHKFIKQVPIDSLQTWDGSPLAGNLLVLPEQGIGDQIFFIGMLSDLRSKVEKLTVCADNRLTPLLSRSYPDIAFTDDVSSLDLSQFNAQIHIGSLGRYLRPNAQALTNVISPYLQANTDRTDVLRNSLKRKDRLLCGISWLSKNADHGNAKSLRLASLANALQLPGFDFVDLQYGDTQGEREEFLQTYGINIIKRDEIDNFSDIDGLASLISACDLVVTVSNTTAHLACALGKPTLVLLPQSSAVFWYWHQRDMHSPWYPTAVLLRQEEFGGWPQVMQVACQILKGMQ